MRIIKFLHSCILIEEGGKRLLIDPGEISFSYGSALKVGDVGPVDVILYTHRHFDHFSLDILKSFLVLGESTVITHSELGEKITAEGIPFESIEAGEIKTVSGFKIRALAAPHEPILSQVPKNLAYMINDRFLHPGDSLSPIISEPPEILALPVAGSWMKIVEALDLAKKLLPKHIIPIHDGMLKDELRIRAYEGWQEELPKADITFHALETGEFFELNA